MKFFEIKIPMGSSLSALAKQYSTSVNAIMKLNPYVKDKNVIKAGASLKIPKLLSNQNPLAYSQALQAGITKLFKGDYGVDGAREKLLKELDTVYPQVDVALDIYNKIPDNWNLVPSLKIEKEIETGEKNKSLWDSIGTFIKTYVIQPFRTEIQKAVFDVAEYTKEIPTAKQVKEISSGQLSGVVSKLLTAWQVPWQMPPVVAAPTAKTPLIPGPVIPKGKEVADKFIVKNKAEIYDLLTRLEPAQQAEHAMSTPAIIPTSFQTWNEDYLEGLTEEEKKKADPSVAWQQFRGIADELDDTIENAKMNGMVFLYNDTGDITGFDEEKTSEEMGKLVDEKIQEHQKALEKVDPFLAEANKRVEENNKIQEKIIELMSEEMDLISDFLSKPENLDSMKMSKFSKDIQEKFGSPKEFQDLDLALKNLKTFQETQGEFMESTETIEKESEEIQTELNSLITPEMNTFFKDQENIENLSDEAIINLQKFYEDNKVNVDKIISLSGKLNDIMDWYSINNLRINNLSARSNDLSLQISDKLEKVVNYFQSPDFIEGISKYSIEVARPQTELLKNIQQFQKNRIWYEDNEVKIKEKTNLLEDRFKDAQRDIDAYVESTNSINTKLLELSQELSNAQYNYQSALTGYEFRAWEHQRDIMEGYMHPFKDKFHSWWEHKGESAMGYVGVVFGNIADIPGPKQVFQVFNWWNEDIYRKHILPQLQYIIAGTVMDLSYLGYSMGAAIWKPKDFTEEELKYWKDEGWVARMEQINTWINIPVEGLEDKVGTMEANRQLLDAFQNPDAYEDLKFKKETNIEDIIPIGRSLTITDVVALNPHIKDPYHIPAGITIRVPRFDTAPKWTNLLPSEVRVKAETKHPVGMQLANLFLEIVTDPQNIYWGSLMSGAGKLGRGLKLKGASKFASLSSKYTWAGKMQGLFDWNSEFLRFIKGKPITPEFGGKFSYLTLPTGKGKYATMPLPDLNRGRSWLMQTSLLKRYPYEFRKAANETSGALGDLNKHVITAEIDDAVKTIGKRYKKAPKIIYDELTNYLSVPWKKPSDATLDFLERFNLSAFDVWELAKKYPKAEGILEDIFKTYKIAKPRAKFVSEMMNESVQSASSKTRSAYFALTRSKGQGAIDAVKDYYLKTYADDLTDINKAFNLFDDFVKETERGRFLFQGSEEIMNISDGVKINMVSETKRVKLQGQRFFVTEKNGVITFLMDPNAYKAGGLPQMFQDVSAYIVKMRMNNLRKYTAYTLDTSFPTTKWEAQTAGSKRLTPVVSPGKHDYYRGDSYLDALVTDFKDNFYSKLATHDRIDLDEILKKLAPDKKVKKEFRYSFKKPWEQTVAERASEGKAAYFAKSKQMQEMVKEYSSVHAYLETAGGLEWFKDLNPKALSQLKMVLNRIPLGTITPRLELQKWILNLDGPSMTEFQKLLLVGEKLTSFQKSSLLKDVSKLGKSRAYKYNKTIRDNKIKSLTRTGVDPADMWKEVSGIKTSVVWNNTGIDDVVQLKKYSSLSISEKSFSRVLAQRKPYLMRHSLGSASIDQVKTRIKDIKKLLNLEPKLLKKMRVDAKELKLEMVRLEELTKIAVAEKLSIKEALSLQLQTESHVETLKALEKLKSVEGQDVTKVLKGFNENMDSFQGKITTLLSTPDDTGKLSILEQKQIALAKKQGHIFEVYDITKKDKAFIKYLQSQNITPQILVRPVLKTPADIINQLDILKWKSFLGPLKTVNDDGILKLMSAKFDWPEIKYLKKENAWLMKSSTGKWVSFTPIDRRIFYKNVDNFFTVLKKELKKTKEGKRWLDEILGKDKTKGLIPDSLAEAHDQLKNLQDIFTSPKPNRGLSKMEQLGMSSKVVLARITTLKDYISGMEDFIRGWNERVGMSMNALGIKSLQITRSGKVSGKVLQIKPLNALTKEHEILQEIALRHSGVKNWIGDIYPRVKGRIVKDELPKGISFDADDFLKHYLDATNISYFKNAKAWKKAWQKQEKLRALKIQSVELELKLKKAGMELEVVKSKLKEIYSLPRLKKDLASADTSEYFKRMGLPDQKVVSDKAWLTKRIETIEKYSSNKKLLIKQEADIWRKIKGLTDDLDKTQRKIVSSSGEIEDLLSFMGADRAELLSEEGSLILALEGKQPLTSDFISQIDKKINSLRDQINHPLQIQYNIERAIPLPKIISSAELRDKVIAKVASMEDDILRLESLKKIAAPFQVAVTHNLLPLSDEAWKFSKTNVMSPELEIKMKSLSSLIEPAQGKKLMENLIDEFPDLKGKLPEITIKGKSIDSMTKEYLIGDVLDAKKALPEMVTWSPNITNPDLTTMKFEPGRILDTLQDAGTVYSARGYLMKSKDIWVDGVGLCNRKFLKKINQASDLRPYLASSGFISIDDWWKDIQRFTKGRDWTPLDDLLKAKPIELKNVGRKTLTSYDYLAKQLGVGFSPIDFSDVITKGVVSPVLRTKVEKVIGALKKKQPKGTWLYEVAKKSAPINTESLFNLLKKWDKDGIKVIIDQTGLLKNAPFSDYGFKFRVISLDDLLPKGQDLTWFTKKVGDIASDAEIAVQTQMRKIFWDAKKIGVIGKEDFPNLFKDNFYNRYLTPNERAFLEGAAKDFRDYQKLARGKVLPGYPFMYPSSRSRWTIELGPGETVERLRPMVEKEYTLHQARNYLDEAGWVNKKLRVEDPFREGTVLLLAQDSSFLTSRFRRLLNEAIERKSKFFLPEKMNKGEMVIAELLKVEKVKFGQIPLNQRIITEIYSGVSDKVPYFILPSSLGLRGSRYKLLQTMQYRNRVVKSFSVMKKELIGEFTEAIKVWKKDINKFPPDYVTEQVIKWGRGAKSGNVKDALARWIKLRERMTIKENWYKQKEFLLRNYEDTMGKELMRIGKRNHLLDSEKASIATEVSRLNYALKELDTSVFKWNRGMTYMERMRSKMSQELSFLYLKQADIYGMGALPVELDKMKRAKMIMLDKLFWDIPHALKIPKAIGGVARSVWVNLVLFWRLGWHVWNSLDDGLRATMASKDIGDFFRVQMAYGDLSIKFLKYWGEDFAKTILEATDFYRLAPSLQSEAVKLLGPKYGGFISDEIAKTVQRKGFKPFDINDYYKVKKTGMFGQMQESMYRHYIRDTLDWRSATTRLPSGEMMSPTDVGYLASQGLYSTVGDPVSTGKIISMLDETTWGNRLWKRLSVMDADLKLYADSAEELRRLMCAHTLLFDKSMTLARAESRVKKYLYDYKDLTIVGQTFRIIFPFYTFNAKSIQLYLGMCLKQGYRTYSAGKALLKAWSLTAKEMPEGYQDRVKIGNEVWWSPHFSIVSFWNLVKDPIRVVAEFIDNPLRTIGGFGWDPFLAEFIKRAQGKGYFATENYLKRTTGWTQWEIDNYLKDQKIENDLSTAPGRWGEFVLQFVPIAPFIKSLYELDETLVIREGSLLNSKVMRELLKFCGLNIKRYDDIEKLRSIYFDLPPRLRGDWVKKMNEENPDLYKRWREYYLSVSLAKIMHAKGPERIKLLQEQEEYWYVDTFYSLEDQNKGAGYDWINKNSRAKAFLQLHWKSTKLTPWRMEALRLHNEKVLKARLKVYLDSIPSTMTEEKISKMSILGIDNIFTGTFTKEELRNDYLDKYGNLRVGSIEEFNLLLQTKGWMEKGFETLKPNIIKEADRRFLEWQMLSRQAKIDKRWDDALYFQRLSSIFNILPKGIENLAEEQQQKFWDEWRKAFDSKLTDEQKLRYMTSQPEVQQQYLEAMEKYNNIWKEIFPNFGKEDFDFFKIFYSKPKWFRDIYFLKHRNKAVWYPFAAEWVSMIMAIEKKEETTGVFQTEDRKKTSEFFWSHEGLIKAWDKDNPRFYEYMKIWKKIFDKPDDNKDYFEVFYSQPQWFKDRFFEKNPGKKEYYNFISEWLKLLDEDEKIYQDTGNRSNKATTWFWKKENKKERDTYGNKKIDSDHTKFDYLKVWEKVINKTEEKVEDYFLYFYKQPTWFQSYFFNTHEDQAVYYPVINEWRKLIQKDQDYYNTNGERSHKARDYFNSKIKGDSKVSQAWENQNKGIIDYLSTWSKIMDITEANPELYFEEFYSQPKAFQDRFFKNNKGKSIYYPKLRRWRVAINLDKENLEKGKKTYIARDYFDSWKNTLAGKLYAKDNMITSDKSIVDYLNIWQKVIAHTEEIPKEFFDIFDKQESWFKEHYFQNHPLRKIYYPFAKELGKQSSDNFSKFFWSSKFKKEREAWEKDKPGYLAYMGFWKSLSGFAEIGNWSQYFDYYFSEANTKYRERHWSNHPEAEERYKAFKTYSLLPSMTWEERKAKRDFLKGHPELLEWWSQDLSEEDAKIRTKVEHYFGLLDNIKADGIGREYYLEYRKWKAAADHYLQGNPEVLLFLQKKPKEYTGEKAVIFSLISSYNSLVFPEEKEKFMEAHPELSNYFLNCNPPGVRAILKIQNAYFDLPQGKRSAYLEEHPELIDWWEVSKLPWSYYFDKAKFRPYENAISKVDKVFTYFKDGNWNTAEKLRLSLPDIFTNPNESVEGDWFKNRVYKLAMKTWVEVIKRNEFMAVYYFRQLPRWIRDQYYSKHPEKRYLSTEPLSRFLEEPLRIWSQLNPEVAWAYYELYKYGKNVPWDIKEKIQEIFLKNKIWKSRFDWTQRDWQEFWKQRALKLNEVKEFDYNNLPLLRTELNRVLKTFPTRVKPNVFGKPRIGVITPFF